MILVVPEGLNSNPVNIESRQLNRSLNPEFRTMNCAAQRPASVNAPERNHVSLGRFLPDPRIGPDYSAAAPHRMHSVVFPFPQRAKVSSMATRPSRFSPGANR